MGRREKMKSKKNKFVIALIVIILIAGGVLAAKILNDSKPNNTSEVANVEKEDLKEVIEEKKINIFSGNQRPIAVMIDNHKGAWPQAGLKDAYMVYEIIVEGGETRLMALFKGTEVENIGPIRSSRHYFLDYALENDAIYTHYGWSPQAEKDISSLKVNNINGISESTKAFRRIKGKSAPHNVMTSIKDIVEIAQKKGYSITSDSESVLKYTADEINLKEENIANTVNIPYSTLHRVTYKYNKEKKVYERYARGIAQKDYKTSEPITTKNIIITFAQNYALADKENKGRQGLKNIGTFDGYYITDGNYIKIKCTKSGRSSKTIYKDLEGNVINVNDGNTFIQICPTDSKVTFE